jgi:hypothetical protein
MTSPSDVVILTRKATAAPGLEVRTAVANGSTELVLSKSSKTFI